jgi:hypothetical protein
MACLADSIMNDNSFQPILVKRLIFLILIINAFSCERENVDDVWEGTIRVEFEFLHGLIIELKSF